MTWRPRVTYDWRGRRYRVWFTTPRTWWLVGCLLCTVGVLVPLVSLAERSHQDYAPAWTFGALFLLVGLPVAFLARRRMRRWNAREAPTPPAVRRL